MGVPFTVSLFLPHDPLCAPKLAVLPVTIPLLATSLPSLSSFLSGPESLRLEGTAMPSPVYPATLSYRS
jgi:hypothetical protein